MLRRHLECGDSINDSWVVGNKVHQHFKLINGYFYYIFLILTSLNNYAENKINTIPLITRVPIQQLETKNMKKKQRIAE